MDAFHEAPVTQFIMQTMRTPTPGSCEIVLHVDSRHHHGAARIHGGILGLLLDNAGFFAAATLSDGFWVATTEYKLNLLASGAAEEVIGTGRVLHRGRHLIQCEMSAVTQSGVRLAVGLASYTVMPRKFKGYDLQAV
ncbi:MAG: PaaI family thioesterase [Sandaracinaceae bacterium]|jgi:acyl-CoA thioesterase|nr:PaaI family thioesterase [Sandaracinaceae bacterium]